MSTARVLKALGDPTRLRIVEFLGCCEQTVEVDEAGGVRAAAGPSAGEVCCHLTGRERVTSTVSHHLHELRDAGLIRIERRGKHMLCSLDRAALRALAGRIESLAKGEDDDCC